MFNKSIVVVGSSNTDMIIQVDRLPRPGETILGGKFLSAAGGKGANQAVGAARAGGNVTFIARVGHDMYGEKAIAGFRADGINVDHVLRDENCPSGVALILVAKNGQNQIAVASGANNQLRPADVRRAKDVIQAAGIVVLQLETPLASVVAAAGLAVQANARVILNPAPARTLPDSLLRKVFLLTPNETEAELLTGIPVTNERSALRAAEKLLSRGVANVMITMGARGVLVASPDGREMIPACKVKAVDATAAGDVFNGALAVSLAEGNELIEAARFATAAAAISVTRLGAQISAPTRREIENLLATGKIRRLPALPVLVRNGHHNGMTPSLLERRAKTITA